MQNFFSAVSMPASMQITIKSCGDLFNSEIEVDLWSERGKERDNGGRGSRRQGGKEGGKEGRNEKMILPTPTAE